MRLFDYMQLCSAIYEQDYCEAMKPLLDEIVWNHSDDSHRLVLGRYAEEYILIICGTRVTDGSPQQSFMDLFSDIDFTPVQVGPHWFPTGTIDGLKVLLEEAFSHVPDGKKCTCTGHSLGAQRAHLIPGLVGLDKVNKIIAFAPPKAASAGYWVWLLASNLTLITVINNADPWADWPWKIAQVLAHARDLTHPPSILWLGSAGWSQIETKNWIGGQILHSSDHFPDAYLHRLKGYGL